MQTEISNVLAKLKELKIGASKIEADLSLANGVLGKTAKGIKGLSEENFKRVMNYFYEKTKDNNLVSETSKVEITEIETKVEEPTKMVVDSEGLKNIHKKVLTREVVDKINKDFGAGTLMTFGEKPNQSYDVISTGSLNLDVALGIGGLPRGRMVEIFGLESSGKTTIALYAIANAQKKGLRCLLVDAENSFDPEYAMTLGVNIDELDYCQPSYGEQGFEVADRMISSGKVGLVVIDSVAAMIPKAELEAGIGDNKMGLHARLMSQVCRKMVTSISKNEVLVIFINQIRNKIGVMFGNPEVVCGGMALQFYASVRLSVSRSLSNENSVMNGADKLGNLTSVKVIKNKCSIPFKTAKFNIIYGEGIDRLGEVVDLGVEFGIIKKSGSWFTVAADGVKLGQGKEAVKETLLSNPDLAEIIEKQILEKISN